MHVSQETSFFDDVPLKLHGVVQLTCQILKSIVNMGQVMKLRLSCYLVLLSVDSKTR